MRKLFPLLLLAGVFLASCASFPKPESDTDTLVVGSFIADFPDGFFDTPARKLDSGLRLDFVNVNTQKSFSVVTGKGGYFFFLANGGDHYQLASYSYDVTIETKGYYRGGNRLTYSFNAEPGSVTYLGHFLFTSSSPQMTHPEGRGAQWSFKYNLNRADQTDDARQYLQQTAPADSPWLSREIKSDFTK